MAEHIEAIIGGVVGTAITAFGVKLVDWIKADSKFLTLSDVVQQSDESMKALDSWVKTYKALAELPDGDFKSRGEQTAVLAVTRLKNRLENADTERTVTAAASRFGTFLGSSSIASGGFRIVVVVAAKSFFKAVVTNTLVCLDSPALFLLLRFRDYNFRGDAFPRPSSDYPSRAHCARLLDSLSSDGNLHPPKAIVQFENGCCTAEGWNGILELHPGDKTGRSP